MKKVILISLILSVLAVLAGCNKDNSNQAANKSKQNSKSESSNSGNDLPFMWEDPQYNIFFTIKENDKQFKYELAHNGTYATGECSYEKDVLKMKCPEEKDIKFSLDNSIKEQQQTALKNLFGDKKEIEFVFDENRYYLFGKGYYVYEDIIIPNYPKQTKYLSDGDTSYFYDMEVILDRKVLASKEEIKLYSAPDVNSQELFFSDFKLSQLATTSYLSNYGYYVGLKNEEIMDEYGKVNMSLLPGLKFETLARSSKSETINGKTGYWYAIQNDKIPDYILHNEKTFAWIFVSDEEFEEYDDSKKLEYTKEFIDAADLKGYIEKTNFKLSRLKDKLKSFYIGDIEAGFNIFYTDDELFLAVEGNGNYITKLNRNQMYVDKDGFLKLKLNNKELLIIEGKRLTQDFSQFENDGKNDYDLEENDIPFRGMNLVEKIESTSSFSEKLNGKTVNYTPDNLLKCFTAGGCKCHPYAWNYKHIPWVEGAEGNGIGESVTITFTKEISGVSILNGFTDIANLKLYKENPRVKTLLVEDLTNGTSKTVSFEDYVYFNFIQFEQPVKKVRLTIEEVYEGTKYSDTCISAVIPHETLYNKRTSYDQFINFMVDSEAEMTGFDTILKNYGWWFGIVD